MNISIRHWSVILVIILAGTILGMFLVSDVVGIISHKNEEFIYGNPIAELRKNAEQGNTDSQYDLGLRYAFGKKVPRNYQKAAMWFRKAAEQGSIWGQYSLGRLYHIGEGETQNFKKRLGGTKKRWRMEMRTHKSILRYYARRVHCPAGNLEYSE